MDLRDQRAMETYQSRGGTLATLESLCVFGRASILEVADRRVRDETEKGDGNRDEDERRDGGHDGVLIEEERTDQQRPIPDEEGGWEAVVRPQRARGFSRVYLASAFTSQPFASHRFARAIFSSAGFSSYDGGSASISSIRSSVPSNVAF